MFQDLNYTFQLSCFPLSEKVKVTIRVPSQQNFGTAMKGFFLQMRDADTNKAVGKWDNNEISWAKGVDCNDEAGFDTKTCQSRAGRYQ